MKVNNIIPPPNPEKFCTNKEGNFEGSFLPLSSFFPYTHFLLWSPPPHTTILFYKIYTPATF